MNPTERLQREWDRHYVWPRRRWQARLLPLGKRLDTSWAPRDAEMDFVTFERTSAFCMQLGDGFEELPLLVDHKRGRHVGAVERLFIRRGWLCASLRLDPSSPWFEVLNSILSRAPFEPVPTSCKWEVVREGPRSLLEGAVLATSALILEVSVMFRSRARIEGAGVYAVEYTEPEPREIDRQIAAGAVLVRTFDAPIRIR